MKPSKDIERLFQERLKDFQASPSPKVWEGIEKNLSQNQPKSTSPFWWRAASIAAILLVFASIGAFYQNSLHSLRPASSLSTGNTEKHKPASNSLEVIPTQYSFSSVNGSLSEFENTIESSLAFQIDITDSGMSSDDSSVETEAVANTTEVIKSKPLAVNALKTSPSPLFASKALVSKPLGSPSDEPAAEGEATQKKSLFDEIQEDELALNENQNESIDKPWALQPNVAPVFMNSMRGGNPIESSLQGKTRSNPNVSFGVNVAYAINKKIKIRTGVNQVAMGYNTQDVILSTTASSFMAEGSSSTNIKNNLIGDVALVSATNSRNAMSSAPSNSSFTEIIPTPSNNVGSINHELGFVEVPLEIEYAILDNKFGLHLLGGASTFLLNNNEVFFEGNGTSSKIGEADNLNNFSFSANFGMGMDYKFSKTFSFNLEPKFMYQINTFQSNDSDFQPYFFGIYSGVRFKF